MPRPPAPARDPQLPAAVLVAVLLTVGQVFWWHNYDAHRSVFSLVMTVLWAVSLTVALVGHLQRMRRQTGPAHDVGAPYE